MIDVTLDMEQYDCPFIHATEEHDLAFSAVHWEFDTATDTLETRMVVEGDDRESLGQGLTELREHDGLRDYKLLSKTGGVGHVRTVIDETAAMSTVRDGGGYITGPFYIADGSELWHVGFDDRGEADGTLSRLDRDNEYEILERDEPELPELQGFIQNAGAAMTLIQGCKDLSDVERETLETAATEGYFESPRSATLGTLAEEFDVSKPAVSKNLRRGQRKMLQRVVDAMGELED
ncbi:helix-turn-helix domain-containing protein [Halobaculum rubrum]|uniref:helix-turn-helix domain-containing protein n=1 Tax=Halobaculum rubrum TaxID=2872158 RepID=UPI001CA44BE1|nr:helix-turn-helix domain-containing protein [Halobaculum rubrum]QZX99066.1 helix-turn-helix domain-containing protein [Halobaculum rubrum]